MPNQFDPFDIQVPPFNVTSNVSEHVTVVIATVPAFNDATVTAAVTAIINKLKGFKGDPNVGQLAAITASTFAQIVRKLSLLGV